MALVTIRLLSDDPSPAAIQGVTVEVYSTLAVFQTSGVTDVAGEVLLILPDASYDLMFFKVGVSAIQPQRIIVDSLLSNEFEVTAHIRTLPESTDTDRCTVSGYVKGVGGGRAIHRLIFEPVKMLTVLSGNVIAPYSRVEITSNEDGYFEFELLRNTKYTAYFLFPQDMFCTQPGKLDVITPDGPAVALSDFLFPVPIHFDFSQNAISVPVSPTPDETITVTLTFSDGSTRETRSAFSSPWAGITLTNTDNLVVEAYLIDGGALGLRGLTPGTATITTVRQIPTAVLIDPLPTYTSESVVVTVT